MASCLTSFLNLANDRWYIELVGIEYLTHKLVALFDSISIYPKKSYKKSLRDNVTIKNTYKYLRDKSYKMIN
jgi:hypothetical protein